MTINMYTLAKKFPLLPRKKNTDKNRYGHSLIVAGSRGMMGAALLASRASLEAGCGLVTLASPEQPASTASRCIPEVMQLKLASSKQGSFRLSAYPAIMAFLTKRKITTLLVGPGLSQNLETARLVRKLITRVRVPTVLDADGINSFKGKAGELLRHTSPLTLTPHRKEFERLFSERWPESQITRIALAKKLSKFYDVVLVLKGHRTLVVNGDKCFVNSTGNPGMAKGGSGDVLAGIINAFICQGLEPFFAACWAVHYHGKAGDLAVKERGELSLLASDIIRFLPKAFSRKI